jgi:hypothetical protein
MEIQYVYSLQTTHRISMNGVEFPPDWLQEPSLRIRKITPFFPRTPSELVIRRLKILDAASPLRWLKKWNVFQLDETDEESISGESLLDEENSICSDNLCKVNKDIAVDTSNSYDLAIITTQCVNAKATENMVLEQIDGYIPNSVKRKRLTRNSVDELVQTNNNKRSRARATDQTTVAITTTTNLELSRNDMYAENHQVSRVSTAKAAEFSCDKIQGSTPKECGLTAIESEQFYPTRISSFKLNLVCPPIGSLLKSDPRISLSWIANPIAFNVPMCRVYYSGFSIRSKLSNCELFMGDYIEISTIYLPKPRTAQVVSCYQAINPCPFKYKDIVNGNTVIVQEKGKDQVNDLNSVTVASTKPLFRMNNTCAAVGSIIGKYVLCMCSH